MKNFTIMNLDLDHLEEICQDIKDQYARGVADCVLFSMTLTPEGDPVADKAAVLCEKYRKFKARLDEMGLRSGILVQATIGHGWVLGQSAPFAHYVNFCNGEETGVYCPYDPDFRQYIYDSLVQIASCAPCHIMVDDDLRLLSARGDGCACSRHMAKFNEYAGTQLERAALYEIVTHPTEQKRAYTDIFVRTQQESVVELAELIRRAIDSVDPTIPGSYCCVGKNAEFAYEIASAVAGAGHPVIVRVNQGHYCAESNHHFTDTFLRAAENVAKLRGKADILLAETDTCPQNRYSTGAASLHTQFTGTVLEGIDGAKHWITKLDNFEPRSGAAYRKILGKYAGFYNTLAELAPTLRWKGFRIPVSDRAVYEIDRNDYLPVSGWSGDVLERLGLPLYFSADMGGIACLDGALSPDMTDEKLMRLLGGKVILASDTAKELIDRGFGAYLGVDVRPWQGKTPVTERMGTVGIKLQWNFMELVPLSDRVQALSQVCNTVDRVHYEPLFPGVTLYENELGGTVAVFCGTPQIPHFNLNTAFSFLNARRKAQLTALMARLGEACCTYPGDEEVYCKTADLPDGRQLCAVFNLGCDPIEDMELETTAPVQTLTKLLPDGTFAPVSFTRQGSILQTEVCALPLEPVIFILQK